MKCTYGMCHICDIHLPQAMGTSFPVSVSVQLQPIVSGVGRQHGIGLTPAESNVSVLWNQDNDIGQGAPPALARNR